jgi:hypothetical protein
MLFLYLANALVRLTDAPADETVPARPLRLA